MKLLLCKNGGAKRLLELSVRHSSEGPARGSELQWRVLRDRAADIIERCVHVRLADAGADYTPLGVEIAHVLARFAPPLTVDGGADDRPRLRRYARRVLCNAVARAALVDDAVCEPLVKAGVLKILKDAET